MKRSIEICLIGVIVMLFANVLFAQSTEFAFQGRLTDSGVPVAVNYDLRFTLYSQSAGGAAIGTVERTDVPVSNGVFTVKLDFGAAAFDGTARWIETEVKPTGGGSYQPLNPRVFLTSVPYSVRSLTAANATQLGGVAAAEFVQTTDPRMIDARPPAPGNGSYIQNTTAAQAASNFSITGNGTVGGTLTGNVVNSGTQFSIGGNRVLSVAGSLNTFAGVDAGSSNTTGFTNSFFGSSAGRSNTTGSWNSFFGHDAGSQNTTGQLNSFFGDTAGFSNTSGRQNSFIGMTAGNSNTTGSANSFFGVFAGLRNTSGDSNSHFGMSSGGSNQTGSRNTIIGADAGSPNGIDDSTAIGFRAFVTQNNSLVLGSINGTNGATSDTKVGIGTTAPSERFEVRDNAASLIVGGAGCPSGSITIGLNGAFESCTKYSVRGDGSTLYFNRPTGGEIVFRENNGGAQLRLRSGGILQLGALGSAGATALCRNATNDIATCSSSIRYKSNIDNFTSGLDLVRKLRPVSFNWKDGGMPDFGLVAEEVSAVEPLLTTTNEKGEVEGVKYDRVGVVLVNAVNEQQEQIEALRKTVSEQAQVIEDLKAVVCLDRPKAAVCRRQ